ncbi:MAG TPA: adenylate/guanylate cyclase domain-containing protein [Aggregatilineaceae bacterium]|nr:adenylate/guanylate cyclase domain-containing protein [Aggregatilineaceae bacterium]
MQCPACGTTNPAQARFCFECGRALLNGRVCPRCFTLLPPQARFCTHCGEMLVAAIDGLVSAAAVAAAPVLVPAMLPDSTPIPVLMARPLEDMLDSLRLYLPEDLFEPLERRPTERNLNAARDHLALLLTTAKTYLPWPVVVAPQPPGVPAGGMQRGTFLLGDMSGFTALSERLARFGPAGAEMITNIINDLFHNMIRILYDHGGMLLKFGGDALIGLFAAETDEQLATSALWAVQAALEMQKGMEKFAAIDAAGETRALKLKCGISSGAYFAAQIGTPQSMAYVTTGHTVNAADEAQSHAEPGDIIIAQPTRHLLGDQVQVEPRAEGYFVLHNAPPADSVRTLDLLNEPPAAEVQVQITYLVERLDRLAPFMPAELIPRIVTNPAQVEITPEHRPVTVMFVNYLGMSDLIDDLGHSNPDLITQRLNDYFVQMAEVVEHYEGAIARMDQYTVGDRLVVFFGAPRAHEDDPVRAVYTALDMQTAMHEHFDALQTPTGIYRFRQRIGINTGQLFAGNVGSDTLRQEYTLMGDDINMSARLMSKADWDEILITKKTRDRVSAFFDLQSRGELKVKGKEILIPTFQVIGRREQIGRTRGLDSGDSPYIGRETVLEVLRTCGRSFLDKGHGHIISIMGDSGIGKSRLMAEFRNWLPNENILWLSGQALSFSEKVSYWLAVQVLRSTLEMPRDASEQDVLFTLWERGEELLGKETAREAIPFLADMMGLKLEGEWAALVKGLSPEVRQKQIFWAAREFFSAAAKARPTVMVLDDLHWADEASLDLIDDLLEAAVHSPIMFCLMSRKQAPGFERLRDHATTEYPHRHTEIVLEPLTEQESRDLLQRLLPGAQFSPRTLADMMDKTSGNPFYIEEVVRSLLETKAVLPQPDQPNRWQVTAEIDAITVPDSLEGALVARIDRLTEDARQALQLASVIGRTFEMQILERMIESETELGLWVAQLERDDLIRPTDLSTRATYMFPNAMVQEVAYDNLLVQRRQEYHRRIGEVLESLLNERLADQNDALAVDLDNDGVPEQGSELLAYHFRLSDNRDKAMVYLELAGRRAQAGYANETAIQHYSDLLALLPVGEETWQQRFDILHRRQKVSGIRGYQDQREADLQTMMELAEAHQDDFRRSETLIALIDLYDTTSRYDLADQTIDLALELKGRLGDQHGQAAALYKRGVMQYYRGNYATAMTALQQASTLQQTIHDLEGEAWSVMYLGMIDYVEGRYSEATQRHNYAFQLAHSRQDGLQEGIHLTNAARVALSLGNYDDALQKFEQSLQMKIRVGDRMGQGFNHYGLGITYLNLEQYEKAEMELEESLKVRRQIGDRRGISYCLHGLGLVALHTQRYEQAKNYFQEAYKLRGELGLKAEMIEDLSALGQVFLQVGRLEEAQKVSDRAMQLFEQQGDVPGEEQEILFNHFRILAARQNPQAGLVLRQTYNKLIQQADRISAPEDRECYLTHSKTNREILAEVERGTWGVSQTH